MSSHDKERHFLYLTDLVWGELKLRAFAEKKSASAVIASLLQYFLDDDSVDGLPVGRYQERIPPESLEQRETRTIFISGELWRRATENRDEEKDYSISGVVEYLLRQYLGLPQIGEEVDVGMEEDDMGEGEDEPDSSNTLNTGSVTFDLGDDPVDLDLSSG
jgi:hypothetical protein